MLAVDHDRHPVGWLAAGGLADDALRGEVTPDLLNLGGTLATEAGTLREALDAALSSPSGRGVIVHEDGRFAGTVSASQVLSPHRGAGRNIRAESTDAAGHYGAGVERIRRSRRRHERRDERNADE